MLAVAEEGRAGGVVAAARVAAVVAAAMAASAVAEVAEVVAEEQMGALAKLAGPAYSPMG